MITYQTNTQDLASHHLAGFFVGWPQHPTPQTHLTLLQNSAYVVIARNSAAPQQNAVGFITAISDGVLSAYIPLLEVLPAYQKQGIGSELVTRMLAQLRHLYAVDLICDAKLQPFYQRFEMHPYTGMILRQRQNQGGTSK